MKLLMHTCCAPCSVYCIDSLRKEKIEPTLFWYNPNIHPYLEYKSRLDCLKKYSKKVNVNAIFEDDYGLDNFCKNVSGNINSRCVNYCYPIRLRKTFEYAKQHGYDAVTTTLLYSIYQKHDFIKKLMEQLSKEYNIEFVYRDFREGFWEGHDKAIEEGLYMQKYCGCIFSEEDRYLNATKNTIIIPEKYKTHKPLSEIKKIKTYEECNQFLDHSSFNDYLSNSKIYGFKKNNKFLSIVIFNKINENTLELKHIETLKDYRNKGYATRLLNSLLNNYKTNYSKVIVGSKADTIHFFVKRGFDNYINSMSKNLMYFSKNL